MAAATTDTRYSDSELAELRALAWSLHHREGLSWPAVAVKLDEPTNVVRQWASDYVTATDAAAALDQLSLFD